MPNIHDDPNLSKTLNNSKLAKVLTNSVGVKSPTFTNYSVEATSDVERYSGSVCTKIGQISNYSNMAKRQEKNRDSVFS